MVAACEAKDKALVSKPWMTSLVPRGEVVMMKMADGNVQAHYILWNAGRAALGWPVVYDGTHVRFKIDMSNLESVIVTNLDDVQVADVWCVSSSMFGAHVLGEGDP